MARRARPLRAVGHGVESIRRWSAAGVWTRVLEALQREADAAGQRDWGTHYVDGTVVRAHQHDQRPDDGRYTPFDRPLYRERNRVERLINRLKQHRRIATRYEKRTGHYAAMLTVAAALLWL